jgi:hypothetical protein
VSRGAHEDVVYRQIRRLNIASAVLFAIWAAFTVFSLVTGAVFGTLWFEPLVWGFGVVFLDTTLQHELPGVWWQSLRRPEHE